MIEGKGYFIWILERCEGGDMAKVATLAKEAGLTHVIPKVANGVYRYNDRLMPALIAEMGKVGIKVCGYQYIYGGDPVGEAARALYEIKEYGITDFIVDAEGEFKQSGDNIKATAYMDKLNNELSSGVMVYLSSYRYPSYHPDFCWSAFRSNGINIDMPQVYWLGSTNSAYQLQKSYDEYQGMPPKLPYFPTGSAFTEGGWTPTVAQVIAFMDKAKAMGLAGCNFWEWYNTRRYLPAVWEAITKYSWPVTPPIPPPPPPPVDDHADIYARLVGLDDKIGVLSNMLTALDDRLTEHEQAEPAPPPETVTMFQVVTDITNARCRI